MAIVERDHRADAGARAALSSIACGGGGPPVYGDPRLGLEGVDAVVDKDRTAAILGRDMEARGAADPDGRGRGVHGLRHADACGTHPSPDGRRDADRLLHAGRARHAAACARRWKRRRTSSPERRSGRSSPSWHEGLAAHARRDRNDHRGRGPGEPARVSRRARCCGATGIPAARARSRPRPRPRRKAAAQRLGGQGRGQGAGARRRARQGRRREARQDARPRPRARRAQILGMTDQGTHRSRRCWWRRRPTSRSESVRRRSSWTARRQRPGVHGERRRAASTSRRSRPRRPRRSSSLPVDPRYGLLPHQAMRAGVPPVRRRGAGARRPRTSCRSCTARSYDAGASLAEINPLVVTPEGEVVALDAKIMVDDNELDRRPDDRGAARRGGGGAARGAGARGGPHLHQARRQRRLLRERRRPRHGDDGPGEVLRRRAGELPRHRRLVESGEGGRPRSRSSPPTRT